MAALLALGVKQIIPFVSSGKLYRIPTKRQRSLLTEFSEKRQLPDKRYPDGYAEALERQQNQLVSGMQCLYRRLFEASAWEGIPLDESDGHPLTHDILQALNLLEPKQDHGTVAEASRHNRQDLQLEPESRFISEPDESASSGTGSGHSRSRHDRTPYGKICDEGSAFNPEISQSEISSVHPQRMHSPPAKSQNAQFQPLAEYEPPYSPVRATTDHTPLFSDGFQFHSPCVLLTDYSGQTHHTYDPGKQSGILTLPLMQQPSHLCSSNGFNPIDAGMDFNDSIAQLPYASWLNDLDIDPI